MHTQRRFFLAFVSVAIGIAVPMTLEPSTAMLVVLWALIAVALLGAVVTWQPVARRIPFRVVHTVSPHAAEDAALAAQCDALAQDIRTWLEQHGVLDDRPTTFFAPLPHGYEEKFDGRVFDALDKLRRRGCITAGVLRHHTEQRFFRTSGDCTTLAGLLTSWARKLRRA